MNTATDLTDTYASFDLARLGLKDIAYVRPVEHDGHRTYAVHGADGRELGRAADLATAVATAHRHELMAVPVH